MLVYVFDDTFEGLLTAVYEAYYRGDDPKGFMPDGNIQMSLVDRYVRILTDTEKSNKVYEAVVKKISRESLENAYHVFLSNEPDKGMLIYTYLRLGFKMGARVNLHLSDNTVLKVHKVCQRVELELHRMMGFVRFRQVEGGIYYASIEPDNNIVELLAPHFTDRFSGRRWVIHDQKRKLAALHDATGWMIVRDVEEYLPVITQEETAYQALWKEFFKTIAIGSRTNPKLQKRLMPVRYWKNLIEVK